MWVIKSKLPRWSSTQGCHALDFEWPGSIRDPSRKNLAFVAQEHTMEEAVSESGERRAAAKTVTTATTAVTAATAISASGRLGRHIRSR